VELTLVINGLFVPLSIYFGAQALLMFNKMKFGNVLNRLGEQEKHKNRLLYASLFLGSALVLLSIVQGLNNLGDISVPYGCCLFRSYSIFSINYLCVVCVLERYLEEAKLDI
jgi:hypothetical protein